jgi:hypothetical protein
MEFWERSHTLKETNRLRRYISVRNILAGVAFWLYMMYASMHVKSGALGLIDPVRPFLYAFFNNSVVETSLNVLVLILCVVAITLPRREGESRRLAIILVIGVFLVGLLAPIIDHPHGGM